jgi:hypothetical protein
MMQARMPLPPLLSVAWSSICSPSSFDAEYDEKDEVGTDALCF